jgi:hypothetical protein
LNVNRKLITIQDISVPSEISVYDNEYASIIFSDNANGILNVKVDGEDYINEHFYSNQFKLPLYDLTIGTHNVEINYMGIEGYGYSDTFNVVVKKSVPKIEVNSNDLYFGGSQELIFKFPINASGYVFVDINGKSYYSQIFNGKATFKIDDFVLGKNVIDYSYDGDKNYFASNNQITVDLDYKYKLSGNDIVMNYGAGSKFNVKVSYSNGNPVNEGSLLIKIDGKSYIAEIKNGLASFRINLKPKTYTITSEYGDVKISNRIVVKSILKSTNFKVKKSAKRLIIKASLAKVNGKYLKAKKITFKFNGKKYTAKTNKKGVAKVTIKKNVIRKLKANKKYSLKINYLEDKIVKTVKVSK